MPFATVNQETSANLDLAKRGNVPGDGGGGIVMHGAFIIGIVIVPVYGEAAVAPVAPGGATPASDRCEGGSFYG